VVDAAAATIRPIPGVTPRDEGVERYWDIGRHWASGTSCAPRCIAVYRHIVTGERRTAEARRPSDLDPRRDYRERDLDSPRLPLVRPAQRYFLGEPRGGRFGLWFVRGDKRRRVSPCASGCSRIRLGAGLLAWVPARDRDAAFGAPLGRVGTVVDVRTRRVRRWRARDLDSHATDNDRFAGVHPTARRLVFEVARPVAGGGRQRVLYAIARTRRR
jgi:hypothetical protein